MPRREKRPANGRDPRRNARRESAAEEPRRRRGRYLAGEANLPKYTPDIALRSIDGHLTRTGTQVMAWYRLAAQAHPDPGACEIKARLAQLRARHNRNADAFHHLASRQSIAPGDPA